MKKTRKLIQKLLKIFSMFLITIIVMFLTFVINGTIEYGKVSKQIDDFKSRGVYVTTIDDHVFYEVESMYDYEDTSKKIYSYELYKTNHNYVGTYGDIMVTSRNPMTGTSVEWIVGMFSKYFYVGHATINSHVDGKYMYESEGKNQKRVRETMNNWMYLKNSPTIIGLRVKTDIETITHALEYCEEQIGKPYNSTFLFNRANSFYCTDLVSRSYYNSGININYDYLATTGNDMILSPNTYMIFYQETVYEGIKAWYHVYYLKDKVGENNE